MHLAEDGRVVAVEFHRSGVLGRKRRRPCRLDGTVKNTSLTLAGGAEGKGDAQGRASPIPAATREALSLLEVRNLTLPRPHSRTCTPDGIFAPAAIHCLYVWKERPSFS